MPAWVAAHERQHLAPGTTVENLVCSRASSLKYMTHDAWSAGKSGSSARPRLP